MSKLILILIAVFAAAGCRTVPRRDLSSREGIIAAHFTVPVKDVERLRGKGYTEEECVGILFIASASYLSEKEVIEKLRQEEELEEIAQGVGVDREEYRKRTRWVLKQTDEYSEEKQAPEEE